MKRWFIRIGAVFAVGFLILTIVNAQWLAAEPKGSAKLVADRGIAPLAPWGTGQSCSAALSETPYTDYLPNTVASVVRAQQLGAGITLVDVTLSADGQIVLLSSDDLGCTTDGSGAAGTLSLEELKALDAGYRYSSDDGDTFPLRGKGVGAIASLAELIPVLPRRSRLMYRMAGDDPATARALLRELETLGRDAVKVRDAFTGSPAAIEPVRSALPEAWVWNADEARTCSGDYRLLGWSGYLPASCRGGTMIVPADSQLLYWGWPNRLIARMEAHGGEIIMTASNKDPAALSGITLPENLGEVPASFNGYLMVDDIFSVAPALHTRLDNRTQSEIDATTLAMQKRRSGNQLGE